MLIADASWTDIEALREAIASWKPGSLEEASAAFAKLLAQSFESVALARVFAVLPLEKLPPNEQQFARDLSHGDPRLGPRTPTLSLLGTHGREPAWCDRKQSRGHLAIPLLDQRFVQGAPMLARLLADLELDLQGLDDGRPIVTRKMLGGRNGTFYVADAPNARDAQGRSVIPTQSFVAAQGIRTVFGMGGAYLHGTLVVTILFTTESLDRMVIDRFPSLISNFKMATSALLTHERLYAQR